jgi:hypothetical protein
MINISYIRLLNAFESFSNAHLQIKRFASDFPEQVPNFGTEKENYPILFVSPNNTIFDENANQFTVDVYCFDIIEKDRININTILSDTNTILNDVYRWFKDGEIFGIDVITDTPTCTPINNGLLDYAAGWQMSITFVVDTYGICEIPFNESPVVITEVCDIVYSQYLTCETLADCPTIIDIQALLPTQDQKDAMDNANGPDASNPFATMADVGGGQVNSDWNAVSGVAEILNKPTIPAAQVNSDWNAVSGVAEILNKPTIPSGTVTSVATAGLISGGTITSSGTITTSMNTNKLVGRFTASSGVMEEITIGSGLTLTGAGTLNNTATPTPLGYYGAFQDVTDQFAAVINTGYPMLLGVTDLSNQVTVVSGSRVTIANTGIYNIQWSGQFTNPLAAEHDVTIWLRKNGVDVPGSAGVVLVPKKHGSADGHILPSWNFLLDVVGGDYYEFVWSTEDTSVYLSFQPAGSPPPSTASVVLTVTQQSGIMAGTGITALNGLTGAVQTFVNDTNVTITSSGTSHTLGWSGTLADSRIASASKWNNAGEWIGLAAAVISPADSTAYLMPFVPALAPATSANGREWKFTKSGTVSNVNLASFQSANGSSENVTVYLRNTTTATDYLCGTFTMDGGLNANTFANFSTSIAINTTDKWSIKILTPAWVTNPTVVYFSVQIFNKS